MKECKVFPGEKRKNGWGVERKRDGRERRGKGVRRSLCVSDLKLTLVVKIAKTLPYTRASANNKNISLAHYRFVFK